MSSSNFNNLCFIPTLNKMGYMALALDPYTKAFVNFAKQKSDELYLDIGCAFGISTFPVLYAGCKIIACDLDERHLSLIKSMTNEKFLDRLGLMKGHLPDCLSFPEQTFNAINVSMVLHFLSGEKILTALHQLWKWLKPEGHLYITVSSPYQGTLHKFIPLYEKRVKKGVTWPGRIEDIRAYIPQRAEDLPLFNHVLTPDVLKRALKQAHFEILECGFFSRKNLPQDIAYQGQEYTGAIAQRPHLEGV